MRLDVTNRRALITGGGGFVGRHLIDVLRRNGTNVLTIGRSTNADYQVPDLTKMAAIAAVLEEFRPHEIYHLAGIARASSPAEFYRVNAGISAALLDAVERKLGGRTTVLLMGSAAEYGTVSSDHLPIDESTPPRPNGHYGMSKLAQTNIGQSAVRRGCRVVLVRAFNILGPGLPDYLAPAEFAGQIARIERGLLPPVIRVGDLTSKRDFINVHDVANVLPALIANADASGQIVNVCTGEPASIDELLQCLVSLSQVPVSVEIDPTRFRPNDIPLSYGSNRRLAELTGKQIHFDLRHTCDAVLDDARRRILA
jgi:GDP-4-dehydro-6-deoxy-D-mannose reductase